MKSRQDFDKRLASLRVRQSDFKSHWMELSEMILPRRGRFLSPSSDYNKGTKLQSKIKDATGTRALRTLAAGMMAGMTSPARPWFRLTIPDPELAEFDPVKMWLSVVEERMRIVFAQSNLYNALPSVYEELGCFGTAAQLQVEDPYTVIRFYPFTCGEYMLALDDRNFVDTCYREMVLSAKQVVQWFGEDNVSVTVKEAIKRNQYEEKIEVVHAIERNIDADPNSVLSEHKEFSSVWYEKNCREEDKFLSRRGFDEFPVQAPRWLATSTDIYGRCPGMEALPEIKQLQSQATEYNTAVAMMNRPPMVAPASLRGKRKTLVPGGVTYLPPSASGAKFEPAFTAQLRLDFLRESIRDTQAAIEETFYSDLFAMITNLDRRQITAREIDERHEEKLLLLGPVLERVQHELLDPIIDRTFNIMLRRGMIPPAPEEIQDMPLKVTYISMLAQAQQAVGTQSVDRVIGVASALSAIDPTAADKLNSEVILEDYADMLGTNPRLLRSDEEVAAIRQQRAEAQQRAEQQEMMARAVSGAEQLSKTDTSGKNALTDLQAAARASQR